jgi:hypothetical protein
MVGSSRLWKYSQQLSIQRAAVGVWNPTVAAVAKRDKWLYFLRVAKSSFSQCKLSRRGEKYAGKIFCCIF